MGEQDKALQTIILEIVDGITQLRLSDEQLELLDYIYEMAEVQGLDDVIEHIEDYRIAAERCSKCGDAGLETERIYEDRGEYFGFPSQEAIYASSCRNCGWRD